MLMQGQQTVAIWVCNIGQKAGIRYSLTPELSPYHGLHVFNAAYSPSDIAELESAVVADFHYIEQDLPPHGPTLAGDQKSTFIIHQSHTVEEAWAKMKSDYRRKIKKASQRQVLVELDFPHFREILEDSFAAKAQKMPFNLQLFEGLDNICGKHNSRKILGLQDENKSIVAAAYFLYDRHTTYYMGGGHVGGTNPMYKLLWEGIKDSLEHRRAFDFEGSMIPGIAQFFRGFGGEQTDYIAYRHSSGIWVNTLVSLKKRLG